jgi:hypothetical protein
MANTFRSHKKGFISFKSHVPGKLYIIAVCLVVYGASSQNWYQRGKDKETGASRFLNYMLFKLTGWNGQLFPLSGMLFVLVAMKHRSKKSI